MNLTIPAVCALVIAASMVGFAKTAISGVGSIAVVLFALALPARESTGALLPLLICGDLVALTYYRRHADWPTLWRLLPAVIPGLLLGMWFLGFADDQVTRIAIGSTLLVMTLIQLWLRRRPIRMPEAKEQRARQSTSAAASVPTGVTAGFTTMTANAGGPVMTLYLVMSRLSVLSMLGTGAWFFLAVNVAKLPFSAGLGLISRDSLLLDALLVPPMLLGALLGVAVIRRIDRAQFERAALALSAVAAALLLTG